MDKDCPECGLKLSLKQISHVKAVYMCTGENCKYPRDAIFTIVNRDFTEIASPKKRDDIDDYIHEILDGWDSGPTGELATNSNNANNLPQVETKPIKSESAKDNIKICEPLDENMSIEVVKREKHDDEANKWNDFKFTSYVIKAGNIK